MSPVTDKLWKKIYEKEFGVANAKLVVERMEKRNVRHKWIKLYEVCFLDIVHLKIIFMLALTYYGS